MLRQFCTSLDALHLCVLLGLIIVVQVVRKKAHPFYGRVVSKAKKFYAHDEKNVAHVGDVVRLEETRPLSKLKRWRLKEVVRQAALLPEATLPEVS